MPTIFLGISFTGFMRILLLCFYGGCIFLAWRGIPVFTWIYNNAYVTVILAIMSILFLIPWGLFSRRKKPSGGETEK